MKAENTGLITGLLNRGIADRIRNWERIRPDPPELDLARHAMHDLRLAEAERHLQRALDLAPNCAEVRTLMGLLHERVGEHHAAFQCYRLALKLDPADADAGAGLLRYCRRFGYDPRNKAINPGAQGLA